MLPLNVEIKDYPFNPRGGTRVVGTKPGPDGHPLYRVFLRLEGPDLPLVKSAVYVFDSSVSPREVTIPRSETSPDCLYEVWLWGKFEVNGYVIDVKDQTYPLSPHYLDYDSYFEDAAFKKFSLQIAKMA